jgi:hypothetical protein
MKKDYGIGPFGAYNKGTTGHILNALVHYGIQMHIVDTCIIGSMEDGIFKVLTSDGKEFAKGKYFENIEQPLFAFTETHYHSLQDEEGNYQLTFYTHRQPSLILTGSHSKDVYPVINECMSNDIRDEAYKLKTDACIFFQYGYDMPESDLYYLNFIDPAKAQLWLDYFNVKVKAYRAGIDAKAVDEDLATTESSTFNKFIPENQKDMTQNNTPQQWTKLFEMSAQMFDSTRMIESDRLSHFLFFIGHKAYADKDSSDSMDIQNYRREFAEGAFKVFDAILRTGKITENPQVYFAIANSARFHDKFVYGYGMTDLYLKDGEFDVSEFFHKGFNKLAKARLSVSGIQDHRDFIEGMLAYYKPGYSLTEALPKYSLEAVAVAAFDKDFFLNLEKYKHLRYGQAFSDHFKLDKMNTNNDHRIRLLYERDGVEARKLIHEMFDFT